MLKHLLIALCALSTSLYGDNPPLKIEKNPRIVVEPDQTDIFAIPLDEDAQDQQEELFELEHPGESPYQN